MNQVVDKVRQELLTAIEKDQLVLPTLPEVALRVREVAEDPDASIDQLVGGNWQRCGTDRTHHQSRQQPAPQSIQGN
ncbi:MAG: hypothetical protein Aseana_12860 [Candidatus Pelagadaptatus aseana]